MTRATRWARVRTSIPSSRPQAVFAASPGAASFSAAPHPLRGRPAPRHRRGEPKLNCGVGKEPSTRMRKGLVRTVVDQAQQPNGNTPSYAAQSVVAVGEPVELSHFCQRRQKPHGDALLRHQLGRCVYVPFPRVLSERRCLIVEGGATLRSMRILHHSALLPLSEDGVTISHVLGAANYRLLAAEEA
jgi:hypothetical protein